MKKVVVQLTLTPNTFSNEITIEFDNTLSNT